MEIEKRSNDAKKFHDLTLKANLKNHTVARDFERQLQLRRMEEKAAKRTYFRDEERANFASQKHTDSIQQHNQVLSVLRSN